MENSDIKIVMYCSLWHVSNGLSSLLSISALCGSYTKNVPAHVGKTLILLFSVWLKKIDTVVSLEIYVVKHILKTQPFN